MRALLLALVLGVGLSGSLEAQTYRSLQPGNRTADYLLSYIQRLVTAPAWNTRLVDIREAYGLPATSASEVTVETREQVCRRAGKAYHRALYPNGPSLDRELVVVEVGRASYVVYDPGERYGDNRWAVTISFGSSWAHVATFVH